MEELKKYVKLAREIENGDGVLDTSQMSFQDIEMVLMLLKSPSALDFLDEFQDFLTPDILELIIMLHQTEVAVEELEKQKEAILLESRIKAKKLVKKIKKEK